MEEQKKTKKQSTIIKTVICVVVMAALVAGYYFYISHKDFTDKEAEQKNLEELLKLDMDTEYPDSPSKVVEYYSELTKCAYNMELTKEQFNDLAVRIRTLFDVELLAENSLEDYTENLGKDVEDFQSDGKKISDYQIATDKEVEYQKVKSENYAAVIGYYHIKKNSNKKTTCQEFMLREDDDGKWRILGFELLNGNEQSEEQEEDAAAEESSEEKE